MTIGLTKIVIQENYQKFIRNLIFLLSVCKLIHARTALEGIRKYRYITDPTQLSPPPNGLTSAKGTQTAQSRDISFSPLRCQQSHWAARSRFDAK